MTIAASDSLSPLSSTPGVDRPCTAKRPDMAMKPRAPSRIRYSSSSSAARATSSARTSASSATFVTTITCSTGTGTTTLMSERESSTAMARLGSSSRASSAIERRLTAATVYEKALLALSGHALDGPAQRIPAHVSNSFLQRDDGVVGDVDVLGTELLAAFGDVAVLHAGVPM